MPKAGIVTVVFEKETANEAAGVRLRAPGVDLALTLAQAEALARTILLKLSKVNKFGTPKGKGRVQ